jgi:tetratricopeptide (TPR) repeat protein
MQLKTYCTRLITCFSIVALPFISFSQSNRLEEKLEKAQEMIQQDKLSDAEKYVEKIVTENPDFGKGWDKLAEIRFALYKQAKETNLDFGNLKVTVQTKDGKTTDASESDDSLARSFASILSKMSPAKIAYSKFVYTLRKATSVTDDAMMCSVYLRSLFVDVNIDSNVNRKALDYFNEAESEFAAKNYNKAATLYRAAIEKQPDFYKASMYLGDCYYAMGAYSDALTSFKAAAEKFPTLLEPRKYLSDAYDKMDLHDAAAKEDMAGILIYPDLSMFAKLERDLYLNHEQINISWTPRGTLPNKVIDTSAQDLNTYSPNEDSLTQTSPWYYYQAAYDKVAPYCTSKGIIKSNPVTTEKYLEIYSWKEMLKNSQDTTLDEARRMQKLNYLDCYVMVTCFHFDFYDQYRDFIANNKEKVERYFKEFTK